MEETFDFKFLLNKLCENATGPLKDVRFFFLVLPFNICSCGAEEKACKILDFQFRVRENLIKPIHR
jgi:hypothetical protein